MDLATIVIVVTLIGGTISIMGPLLKLVWYSAQTTATMKQLSIDFAQHVQEDTKQFEVINNRTARHSDTFDQIKDLYNEANTRIEVLAAKGQQS